jgi:hypothetical protein
LITLLKKYRYDHILERPYKTQSYSYLSITAIKAKTRCLSWVFLLTLDSAFVWKKNFRMKWEPKLLCLSKWHLWTIWYIWKYHSERILWRIFVLFLKRLSNVLYFLHFICFLELLLMSSTKARFTEMYLKFKHTWVLLNLLIQRLWTCYLLNQSPSKMAPLYCSFWRVYVFTLVIRPRGYELKRKD